MFFGKRKTKPQSRELTLFADYFQFYVCDKNYKTDTGEIWDKAASDRMLAIGPDLIGVGTARNMDVPVLIEILTAEPGADYDGWERVIQCGISVPSGTLLAFGCTDEISEAERFAMKPGKYSARVSYAGLDDLSEDGLDGNDRYRVQLWPGKVQDAVVLKQ